MSPKISEWASVAEIASGVAVVVTLVILIFGIRENTSITRVSVYSDIIEGLNESDRHIYSDPELARIYDAYWNLETAGLDGIALAQVLRMGPVTLRNFENESGEEIAREMLLSEQRQRIRDVRQGRMACFIC